MEDWQIEHNRRNQLDIDLADKEFELNEAKGKIRNLEFRLANPDADERIKAIYGINMIGRRTVCQIKYV